jgi:predicted nucleic acid-binding protein
VPFALDASTTLAWFLPDEASATADQALDRLTGETALVPPGWSGEVANGFLVAERRGRLTAVETARSLARLSALPIRVVPTPFDAVWDRALGLAREHNLTAYDAAYLELAIRERAALATLDVDLRAAAHRAGVPLVGGT